MKYINENIINELLDKTKNVSKRQVSSILEKAKKINGLDLKETAMLLSVNDENILKEIFETAEFVKNSIYGKRIVLFAPLYISNYCSNNCLYCAFRCDNSCIQRKSLTQQEIIEQVKWLLNRGHKRILIVSGEYPNDKKPQIDYYLESIKTVYSVNSGQHKIRRININCAPMSIEDFKKLKASGIGTYQLFQETYHDTTYRYVHPSGHKSDPDKRLDAIDNAFKSGIDDVGIGVLYGLYDYKFETLALLMHIRHLEKTFKVGPHTISVPRVKSAPGSEYSNNLNYAVLDKDFLKIVAVLRLSVPYTGIILSTRETPQLRNKLVSLGVSQISAESKTSPGGYSKSSGNKCQGIQFNLNDTRTMDEIIGYLIKNGFIPSFCASCYRKNRTGKSFMKLAKPGKIKNKCNINAIITLKEYLDDFASPKVKKNGYTLITKLRNKFDIDTNLLISNYFNLMEKGHRDIYV